MSRLILSGACGRMGRLIAEAAPDAGFEVIAGVDRYSQPGFAFPLYGRFQDVQEAAELIIDFSSASALDELLDYSLTHRLPLMLGATGYDEAALKRIGQAAQRIPTFHSSNMSRGVYALRKLAAQAAKLLPGYDIEIVERHHNQKADAPSGTALSLYEAVRKPDSHAVYGREGREAKRGAQDIGLHALRGGTVAGEHEVGFYGPHESIRLSHIAESRALFAEGALQIARWLMQQPPGLYGMDDFMQRG